MGSGDPPDILIVTDTNKRSKLTGSGEIQENVSARGWLGCHFVNERGTTESRLLLPFGTSGGIATLMTRAPTPISRETTGLPLQFSPSSRNIMNYEERDRHPFGRVSLMPNASIGTHKDVRQRDYADFGWCFLCFAISLCDCVPANCCVSGGALRPGG